MRKIVTASRILSLLSLLSAIVAWNIKCFQEADLGKICYFNFIHVIISLLLFIAAQILACVGIYKNKNVNKFANYVVFAFSNGVFLLWSLGALSMGPYYRPF